MCHVTEVSLEIFFTDFKIFYHYHHHVAALSSKKVKNVLESQILPCGDSKILIKAHSQKSKTTLTQKKDSIRTFKLH